MTTYTTTTNTDAPIVSTSRTRPLYRGSQVIWYILDVIEALLALRFILKLLAANPGASFTNFIYSLSGIFTAPFTSVFRSARVEGSVFEWTTLLAMIFYWLVAWGIIRLIVVSKPVSTTEAAVKLDRQDVE